MPHTWASQHKQPALSHYKGESSINFEATFQEHNYCIIKGPKLQNHFVTYKQTYKVIIYNYLYFLHTHIKICM